MDRADVLYDAFKESYIQSRKVYRVTTVLCLFSLLIVSLVFRDNMIVQTSQPKMSEYKTQIDDIEQQIADLSEQKFKPSNEYRAARINYDAAKLKVDAWPHDLPARKKMKEKYEKYLGEYSNSHDKVLERLKIDGEPGLDLFANLRDAMVAMDESKKALTIAERERDHDKRTYADIARSEKLRLETKKEKIIREMSSLKEDISRIQYDETRLPWLGLRVNPKDLLPFIPILLLIFFHVLFDRFDEIITIIKNPQLDTFRQNLRAYPLPIFLDRHNFYSILTSIIFFSVLPAVQIVAVVMTYKHQIGLFSFGANSWLWMTWIGTICCIITVAYPVITFVRNRYLILNGTHT